MACIKVYDEHICIMNFNTLVVNVGIVLYIFYSMFKN